MLDKYGTWVSPKDTLAQQALTAFAQSFVNTVRKTEGNNLYRNLIICTYGASCGGWHSENDKTVYNYKVLEDFVLPKDLTSNHLMVSVHSYIPWNWDQNHGKLDESRIAEIKDMYNQLDRIFIQKDCPVVIGEYGALFVDGVYASSDSITEEDKDEGAKYASLMVSEAKKRGIASIYFMGLIDKEDRTSLTWSRPKTVEAIIEANK